MVELFIKVGLLLAVFASIFLVSQIALNSFWTRTAHSRAVNERLSLIKRGFDREQVVAMLRKNQPKELTGLPAFLRGPATALQRTIAGSGTPFTVMQVQLGMVVGTLIVFALILVLIATTDVAASVGVLLLATLISMCVGVLLPLMILSMIATRRRRRVEQQFPIALDVFVRALKAGHPIASALVILTQEMEDPIGSEFGLVSDEVSYGAELTDALTEMAERWDLDDIRMFVVSLSVQSETGGNLAEILENLSGVIRERASLFMKVRALSSEGRMTGWLLTALPIFAFVGMFSVNPGFYLSVAEDSAFTIGLCVLMAMYTMGFLMIRKMIDIKV
ncbi:type II secretion system F family protein [Aurantiacibacter marinus]|uniref:Secretion system protein n=1 Tax=Aurantiacibacter marinus TaxID=874156 RepID=A0A0H0XP90_9SPHN|nr:type II secretion system F family protein [Aurantiacibacter marinus]KLI64403.1 secretion system protein [Aurantiacibacter marinus]